MEVNVVKNLYNLKYEEIIYLDKNLTNEVKLEIIKVLKNFNNDNKIINSKRKDRLLQILKEKDFINSIEFIKQDSDVDIVDYSCASFCVFINNEKVSDVILREFEDDGDDKFDDLCHIDQYNKGGTKYGYLDEIVDILNNLISLKLFIENRPYYNYYFKFEFLYDGVNDLIDFIESERKLIIKNPYYNK